MNARTEAKDAVLEQLSGNINDDVLVETMLQETEDAIVAALLSGDRPHWDHSDIQQVAL